MIPIADLTQWWNLIYVLPFCAGVFLIVLSVAGMGRLGSLHAHAGHGHLGGGHGHLGGGHAHGAAGHGHAGHGPGPGAHPAAGGHAPANAQGAAGHSAQGNAHPSAHAQGQAHANAQQAQHAQHQAGQGNRAGRPVHVEVMSDLFAVIGVGKVPLPVVLEMLLVSFGMAGWIANQILLAGRHDSPPEALVGTSLVIALVAALLCTRILSEALGRVTPQSDETYALEAEDLVGHEGEVVFQVTDSTGCVHVFDHTGALHELRARARPGIPSLQKGERVVVVDYDPAQRLYWVDRWEAPAA